MTTLIAMRRIALCIFLLAFVSANGMNLEETVDALKARLPNAAPDDRPELCIRIAQHLLHSADLLYNDGHVDDARTSVEELVAYAEKARDAAIVSKKHLKNVEIDTRKMSERLRDIKRTLAFEDQPPLDQAIRRLEEIRTVLLQEMFAKKKDKK